MNRRDRDVPIYALLVGGIWLFLGVVAVILLGSAVGAIRLHVEVAR